MTGGLVFLSVSIHCSYVLARLFVFVYEYVVLHVSCVCVFARAFAYAFGVRSRVLCVGVVRVKMGEGGGCVRV